MLKKSITYTNVFDDEVTEEWYFGLTKAELAEQALTFAGNGDYATELQKIVASGDAKRIITTFKDILNQAVGRREGNRFVKNQSISAEFNETGAFSALFMELVTNANAAAEFINGVIPADLAKEVAAQSPKAGIEGVDDLKPDPKEKMPYDNPQTDWKPIEAKNIDLDTLSDEEMYKALSASAHPEEDNRPAWLKEQRKPTQRELMLMSREEMKLAFRFFNSVSR